MECAEIDYLPITRENLDVAAKAGAKWGMPRSVGWYARILFDPTVEDLTDDPIRGHMAVLRQTGEVVAIQCYYYHPLFFKCKKYLAMSGCIMGASHDYAAEIFCVLEENEKTHNVTEFFCTNDLANIKSASIHKFVHKANDAPIASNHFHIRAVDISICAEFVMDRVFPKGNALSSFCNVTMGRLTWFLSRPVQWMIDLYRLIRLGSGDYDCVCLNEIPMAQFETFWKRFLASNCDSVVSSREPQRLKWLFEESIKARKVQLIVAMRDGLVDGYVMTRRCIGACRPSIEIIDICAVNNDAKCLSCLINACNVRARKCGVLEIRLFMYRSDLRKWFSTGIHIKRQLSHITFLWAALLDDARKSLEAGDGWFFGPFDGERCMGYGGFIDL